MHARQEGGMDMASETMTIRVSRETKEKLEKLSAESGRDTSDIVDHALSSFADSELENIEGIRQGIIEV